MTKSRHMSGPLLFNLRRNSLSNQIPQRCVDIGLTVGHQDPARMNIAGARHDLIQRPVIGISRQNVVKGALRLA